MIIAALPLLFAVQAQEPPTTVNGAELGPAEDFTTKGPATVCLRELVIRPAEGQSVQLGYSGIHSGTLILILRDGTFIEVSEGESYRDQRERRQRTEWRTATIEAYRIDDRGVDIRYQIEGSGITDRWDTSPRALVSGTALKGGRKDRLLFKNIAFEEPAEVECDQRYEYGWGVIFGEEPLATSPVSAENGEEK